MKDMNMKFKKEHIKDWKVCPFCGSSRGVYGHVEDVLITGVFYHRICPNCKKKWHDRYVLKNTYAID